MSDIYSIEKRSLIMAAIKNKNTKPETLLRSALFKKGFRFRKNLPTLKGKPDIVLPKYKSVIFVNGCFWHSHRCKFGALPKTNTEFWTHKINRNVQRDKNNYRSLRASGWRVIVVWQCQLSSIIKFQGTLNQVIKILLANVYDK